MSDVLIIIITFISTLIYSALFAFSLIGTQLYFYAYRKMKRSPIIGALAFLLLSITIDSLYWTFVEFSRFVGDDYPEWAVSPIMLIIIKGIFTFALISFVIISIKEEKPVLKKL